MGLLKISYWFVSMTLGSLHLTVWMLMQYSTLTQPVGKHSVTTIANVGFRYHNVRTTPGYNWRERPVVFLSSYMHGGSSIFGSMFEMHPGAMYLYEPIDAMYSAVFGTRHFLWPSVYLNWENGTYRNKSKNMTEMVEHYIQLLMDCNFEQLPPGLTDFVSFSGKHTCHSVCPDTNEQRIGFPEHLEITSTFRHKPCSEQISFSTNWCSFAYLQSTCRASRLVALKMLRYDPADFQRSLVKSKNTYLIHHIRDPRAIVQSFIKDGDAPTESAITNLARNLCNEMRHDLDHVMRLRSENPNRVKLVRHEDFASDPTRVASELYRFLGFEHVARSVTRWLLQQTNAKEDSGKYTRKNSSETAWKWQNTMLVRHREIVHEQCFHVWDDLITLGYVL